MIGMTLEQVQEFIDQWKQERGDQALSELVKEAEAENTDARTGEVNLAGALTQMMGACFGLTQTLIGRIVEENNRRVYEDLRKLGLIK